jgi:hypothetical protein
LYSIGVGLSSGMVFLCLLICSTRTSDDTKIEERKEIVRYEDDSYTDRESNRKSKRSTNGSG